MKQYKTIIGIDAGKSGAIGIWKFNNFALEKMPAGGFMEIMNLLRPHSKDALVLIEKVGHFRGEDPRKKFGIAKLEQNFTECKNAAQALEMDVAIVPSITWQSGLRIAKIKGETYAEKKERLYQIALKKVQLSTVYKYAADAALITLFGKHLIESDPEKLRKLML